METRIEKGKLICTNVITKEEFDNFYKSIPERVLVILDEAYFEYAADKKENSIFGYVIIRAKK